MTRLQEVKRSAKLFTSLLVGLLLAAIAILLLVRPASSAVAAPCMVGSGPYLTIQSAIDDLNCDPISVPAGTYSERLVITRSLTLQGTGSPTIDGGGLGRTVTVDGAGIIVRISGFQISGGDASTDPPTPIINTGRIGGGVLAENGATLYLESSRVYGNVARGSGNFTGIGGGVAVYTNSVLHGSNLQIDNNVANASGTGQAAFGGGLAVMNATAYVTNALIYSNSAKTVNTSGDGRGGGIYVAGETNVSPNHAVLYLSNSQVLTNTAYTVNAGGTGYGGGLFVGDSNDTRVTLYGNYWRGNQARSALAGVAGEGYGGAIAVDFPTSDAELSTSFDTFSDNVANAGNASQAQGGAIYLNTTNTAGYITATLTGVTLTDNIAKTGSGTAEGQGGAIYGRHATVYLNQSTILDNQATTSGDGDGGGIYVREPLNGQSLELINSILADNTALGANGDGAQLHVDYTSGPGNLLSLVHTTVANDGLNPKQGIYYRGTSANDFLAITNTIIASHTAGIDNVNATGQLSGQYLLFFGNTADQPKPGTTAFPITTTWFAGNPNFVDSAAGDYHIKTGSAAIDIGTNAGVTIDIDGDPRPQVGPAAFDIGADEAIAQLTIAKYGPATAEPGLPIQYTLQVTNTGYYTTQNLVITDSIPAGATYVSGGTQVGNMVQWNVASLPAGQPWQGSFTVTAQTDITNDDYGVNTDHGVYAVGANAVTTIVSGQQVYLPLVLK